MTHPSPRLYNEFAGWFHLLTAPASYAEEASHYIRLIEEGAASPVKRVLELGSGGGNNASHMKAQYELTLTDLSPAMLGISRELNPECEHIEGDMRTLRLGRTFDAVFIHDAIAYITTEADLAAAIGTAFVHCAPGGCALFVPDDFRDGFEPRTDHGGHDGADRAMRYLEWTSDPDPSDTEFTVDFVYAFRDEDGGIRIAHDRHINGVFPRATWTRLLESAGFAAEFHTFTLVEEEDPLDVTVIVARKPG